MHPDSVRPCFSCGPVIWQPGSWGWALLCGLLLGGLSPLRGEGLSAVWWGDALVANGESSLELRSPGAPLANNVRQVAFSWNHLVMLKDDGTLESWGGWAGGFPIGLTRVKAFALAGGSVAGVALHDDGTLSLWGFWQWSDPGLTDVVEIAAGEEHFVARRSDGSVVTGGHGAAMAVDPPLLDDAVAVVADGQFSAALRRDGTVVAWGFLQGQPVNLPDTFVGVERLHAGFGALYGVRRDGTLAAWGLTAPSMPPGLSNIVSVSIGWYHALALKKDGTVVAWGSNGSGQLSVPKGLTGVVEVVAAGEMSAAVRSDGTLVLWGRSGEVPDIAALGVTSFVPGFVFVALGKPTPPSVVRPPAHQTVHPFQGTRFEVEAQGFGLTYQWLRNGLAVSAATNREYRLDGLGVGPEAESGTRYSVVVRNPIGEEMVTESAELRVEGTILPGTVLEWSGNPGSLRIPPEEIHGQAVAIATGLAVSAAILADGSVHCWNQIFIHSVQRASELRRTDSLAVGGSLWFERQTDGQVQPWDFSGRPYAPTAFPRTQAISTQGDWAYLLDENGSVWRWAPRDSFQTWSLLPVSGIRAIATQGAGPALLRHDGTVVIADGSPVPAGLSNVVDIAAGGTHVAALRADGTVVAWGGIETSENDVPQGLDDVIAIAAGDRHTLALRRDGTVVGWGLVAVGNYTWGGIIWREYTVPAGLRGVTAIAAGSNRSMVLLGGLPAPRLTLQTGAGMVSAFWHENGTPLVLQSATQLNPPHWTPGAGTSTNLGLWRQQTLPAHHDSQFYRLAQP